MNSTFVGSWQALELQETTNVVTRNLEMSSWTLGSHWVPCRLNSPTFL